MRTTHGGKRPGAGAPRGNWNALKHGRYSPRLHQLFAAATAHPEVGILIEHLAFRAKAWRRLRPTRHPWRRTRRPRRRPRGRPPDRALQDLRRHDLSRRYEDVLRRL